MGKAAPDLVKDADLGELSDDAIAGSWRLWQRRAGHRYSIDDVLTAAQAVAAFPEAKRVLDLGCGIASVLLMVAYRLPLAEFVGIEAQALSFELARRNVERNALLRRARLIHADFRDPEALNAAEPPFDLITGTPPYMPPGSATPAPDSQRHYARIEMRGGVEAYVEAIAQTLAPQGRAVLCANAYQPERLPRAAERWGLPILQRCTLIPRAGSKALFQVWTLGGQALQAPAQPKDLLFVARDAEGKRSSAYRSLRREFDLF